MGKAWSLLGNGVTGESLRPHARHLWSVNRMTPAWKDEGVGDRIRPVFFSHEVPGKHVLEQVEREEEERGPRAAKFSHRLEPVGPRRTQSLRSPQA